MEAIASTAQDLWASLAARVVSDPLVLVLLVVLAVLFAMVLGLSVGGRPVRRALRTLAPSVDTPPPLVEPEVTLSEPAPLGLDALLVQGLSLRGDPGLRGMGHLREDPDQSLIEWQTQVLNAYVGRPVVESCAQRMTRTSQPARWSGAGGLGRRLIL